MINSESKKYLNEKVYPVLERMIVDIIRQKPANSNEFMIKWLQENGEKIEMTKQKSPKKQKTEKIHSDSEEEEDEDEVEELNLEEIKKKTDKKGQRGSVSAEAYGAFNKKGDFKPVVYAKEEDQIERIKNKLDKAFMFQALGPAEQKIVIDAMQEFKYAIGDSVITQGEDGETLYVVDQGELDCYKKFKKDQVEDTFLKTYYEGESFGELSLLYNAPRAATIKAKTAAVCFALDRNTFNHIVKDAASKKRERYEEFLKKVDILSEIEPYERLQIADAVRCTRFKKDDYILRDGEVGDEFYFLEEGECAATKILGDNTVPEVVFQYKPGSYFGEIALLRSDAKRAANVVAQTDVTVASLDRNCFKRLLGPLEDILKRNFHKYENLLTN